MFQSLWIGMIACISVLCLWYYYMRKLDDIEAFDESLADIYSAMNLLENSDSARRSLVRSALIKQRAQTLNLLRNLSTKVAPNCYDSKDANYNSSLCRTARNQRQAEITAFVNQAIVSFCASHPDCKSVSRATYVTDAWKTKCANAATQSLQQQALNTQMLTRNNDNYVYLPKTTVKSDCASVIGIAALNNANTLSSDELQKQGLMMPAYTDAATIIADATGIRLCKDTKLRLGTDLQPDPNTTILLKKPGKNNAAMPMELINAIQAADSWLDTYWYFQDDPTLKKDADRIQRCSQALSTDDFLTMGQSLFDTNAVLQVASDVSVTATQTAIDTTMNTTALIQQYNSQRSLQKYPQSWYLSWQKALSDRYVDIQALYNQKSTDLANIQQSPLYAAYAKYQALISLSVSDISGLNASILQSSANQMQGSPICFTPGTEQSFKDVSCCNLKLGGHTFSNYCPNSTSLCASIAQNEIKAPGSKAFRSCKDVFSSQIAFNKYNDALTAFRSVPAFKTLSDNMATVVASQTDASKQIQLLQQVLKLCNADVAASSTAS